MPSSPLVVDYLLIILFFVFPLNHQRPRRNSKAKYCYHRHQMVNNELFSDIQDEYGHFKLNGGVYCALLEGFCGRKGFIYLPIILYSFWHTIIPLNLRSECIIWTSCVHKWMSKITHTIPQALKIWCYFDKLDIRMCLSPFRCDFIDYI